MRIYDNPGDIPAWQRLREKTIRAMEAVMGPLPPAERTAPLEVTVMEETATEHYLRRKIHFQTESDDRFGLCRVRAWVLIPHHRSGRAAAAMLCLHPTNYAGKDELVGLQSPTHRAPAPYAHELALRGYLTISPDYPMFGETAPMAYARGYASETMKGIWNHMRAVDVLESMSEVDASRIGVIGHSLGGHNALFAAAFDQRLRAVITSCGFTSFAKYYGGDLSPWSQDRYMPRVATVYGNDPARMPFDFSDVLSALAPRPILINAPLHDANFDAGGVDDCVEIARRSYALFNAADRIVLEKPDAAHAFPDEARQRIYAALDRHLQLEC